MRRFLLHIISAVFLHAGALSAQVSTEGEVNRLVYKKELSGGLIMDSRGFGINGRYIEYIDGFNKEGLEIELTKIRHPKEVTTPAAAFGNGRGFVFGRMNSMFALRGAYYREKILFDKRDKGSISIAWNYSGGLSIGLLKPIYVQRYRTVDDEGTRILVTERYNPSAMPASSIVGEASFFRGVEEMNFKPGVHVKSGFIFDYQLMDDKITSLEVGALYDFYFTDVKIFDPNVVGRNVNKLGFLQLYFAFNIGKKKND